MRTGVIVFVAVLLGCLFVVQKQHERLAANAKTEEKAAIPQKPAAPRPVSEHNWAKHALDTTRKVTDQVAKQRKDDGVRK